MIYGSFGEGGEGYERNVPRMSPKKKIHFRQCIFFSKLGGGHFSGATFTTFTIFPECTRITGCKRGEDWRWGCGDGEG